MKVRRFASNDSKGLDDGAHPPPLALLRRARPGGRPDASVTTSAKPSLPHDGPTRAGTGPGRDGARAHGSSGPVQPRSESVTVTAAVVPAAAARVTQAGGTP
jgi:hypothetical protein